MAQAVGGVLGATVGFLVGGPSGAQWGWAIGAAVGNSFTTIKQPRLGDLAEIRAGEGGPRARVYGQFRPIGGQIVWSGAPREIRTRQRQGKGGPKVESSTLLRSYAIGICEGPITGVSRIWRNNELVYDVRPGSTMLADSAKWIEGKTILLGRWDQLPHPTIEAEMGAANAPAMRGTAMLVVTDEDLTDLRGAIPAYQFEVNAGQRASAFTMWNPADISGAAGLTLSEDRLSVWKEGSAPPDDASEPAQFGFSRVRGAHPKNSGRFYFEIYTEQPPTEWADVYGPPASLRVGLARRSYVFAESNVTDPVFFEVADRQVLSGERGLLSQGGGAAVVESAASTTVGQWVGFAVECIGTESGSTARAWMNIDGAWAENGKSPKTHPLGQAELTTGFTPTSTEDGVVPVAVVRYPLASHPLHKITANFGQQAFGIGAPAFEAGGDLEGFTPGWTGSATDISASSLSLQNIVSSICVDARLDPSMFDVSLLPDLEVFGFATSPDYSAVEAIKELAKVYFFDAQDADGKVRFIPRGGDFVRVIDEAEFVEGEDEPETDTTRDSISVPRLLHLMYFDVSGGQAADKQFSERQISPRSEAPTVLSTPVIMDAETAARAIRIQHQVMEEELRGELVFGLSDKHLDLASSDVIALSYRGRSQRIRFIEDRTNDGWQGYKAVRDRQSAYTATVQATPPATVTNPPSRIVGPTRFAFLDIPALTQAGDVLSYHVAVCGELPTWRGAAIERQDGGSQWSLLATDGTGTVMGTLTAALPLASEFYPDETNAITVALARADDDLEGITREAWLSRGNACALVRADGTAEIVQFRDAVETTPGTWQLTGLQRGRLNSGASAHPIGAAFVLLDGALLLSSGSERIGTTLTHRAYSVGETPTTATPQARTWTARSQREWPPIIETAVRTVDTLAVTWTPRHRFGSEEAPVASSHFDGWRIEATSGSTTVGVDSLTPSASLNVAGLTNPITVTVRGRNRLAGLGDAATRIVP
jgi:hypothetical protein